MKGCLRAAGGVVLVAGWLGSVWWGYGQGVDAIRQQWAMADARRGAAEVRADLEGYRAETERLHALSQRIEATLSALRHAQPKIIERYNHVVEKQPLPAECRPGADRLRELNAAIEAANAAASGQLGQVVSSAGAGDGG